MSAKFQRIGNCHVIYGWFPAFLFIFFSAFPPTTILTHFAFCWCFVSCFQCHTLLHEDFPLIFHNFIFPVWAFTFLFFGFWLFVGFFSSLFLFFADELLNANDKISRSSSSNPIRNNTMHYAHSHNVHLIQSTSSSITNLMASTETIASGAGPRPSKYAKKSRKRQKRRRKRNWASFRASSLLNFLSLCDFLIFVEKGKKNLKYCSYYVGRRRWPPGACDESKVKFTKRIEFSSNFSQLFFPGARRRLDGKYF